VAAQVGDQGDQVGLGAGEPVEADNDQCVAGAQVVQTGLELGSFSGAAGPLLGEYPQAPDLGQGSGLPVEDLVRCGHPRVPDQGAGQNGWFAREQVSFVRGCVHPWTVLKRVIQSSWTPGLDFAAPFLEHGHDGVSPESDQSSIMFM